MALEEGCRQASVLKRPTFASLVGLGESRNAARATVEVAPKVAALASGAGRCLFSGSPPTLKAESSLIRGQGLPLASPGKAPVVSSPGEVLEGNAAAIEIFVSLALDRTKAFIKTSRTCR